MDSPLIQDVSLFLDDKPSVFALRQKAKTAFLQTGFPDKKSEAWKYTDIKPLITESYAIDTSEHSCGHKCCHAKHAKNSPFINLNFCHGKLHIEEFNAPDGLTITPLPLALFEGELKKYIFSAFSLEQHPFAALNGIYLEQGICIHVEKDTQITSPLLINYNQSGCSKVQLNIHNLIILEKGAKLELIERFYSDSNNNYLTNTVNEIYLKSGAAFNHYKIQKESASAGHIALNAAKLYDNASYKQYYLANGAKICRQESLISLERPQANAELYSAYTAKKECLNDITANINHLCAETYSNQYAKAVLEADSSATFQGKIHIAPNAQKTNGHQLHKALYLNDNAELNCKPELEIYADDVKCSHGASCGEIDKEQLFYLTSRGIEKETAIQMLTAAYTEEIIALIPNETIKELFNEK